MSHFQESHSPSEMFTRIRLIIKIVARAVSLMCHIHIPYLDKKKKFYTQNWQIHPILKGIGLP